MAGGTDIYIISGSRAKSSIGWGPYVPSDLSADSVPDFDNWGPDNYWSCMAFALWFELMEEKYGFEYARQQFIGAWDIAVSFGSYHSDCIFNNQFRNFFNDRGIDVDDLLSSIVMPVVDAAGNVAQGASDAASGAGSTLTMLGKLLPWAVGSAIVYYGYDYVKADRA